jgi:hypothetical protein
MTPSSIFYVDDEIVEHVPVFLYPKQNAKQVLFIDECVSEKNLFVTSCNNNTVPVVYSTKSTRENVLNSLRENFASIDRIAFVYHDNVYNGKEFLEGQVLLDSKNMTGSQNFQFLTNVIEEFQVKNIDFLACDTLQYDDWQKFYSCLNQQTGVIVGASNDKTGNISSGADWLMESTHEDIKQVYFNEFIDNYMGYLASTVSQAGGILQVRQSGLLIEYSSDSGSTWNAFSSWPVTIVNTTPASGTELTVLFTTNITISAATVGTGTNGYFECGSNYIIFDGNNKTVTVDGVTGYFGLFRNGTDSIVGTSNITIQNFFLAAASASNLAVQGAWLCHPVFGNSAFNTLIKNITNSANIGLNQQNASICGRAFAQGNQTTINSSSAIVENCTNSGEIQSRASGGIIGLRCGQSGGNVIVRNCSNTGAFNSLTNTQMGGIVGQQTGRLNTVPGNVTIENCVNTADITVNNSAGICGLFTSIFGGIVTITNCFNTGNISGEASGGICGAQAGQINGLVTINKCYNTGNILSIYSGGIVADTFGYDSNQPCSIKDSYNIGNIIGQYAGGICGSDVGYSDNALYTSNVLLENCYNVGDVLTAAAPYSGGIFGGSYFSVYATTPTVVLKNAYNNGIVSSGNSSFAAPSLAFPVTYINTYAADGSWSDSAAQAALTGYPTSLTSNNPAATWFTLGTDLPYLLTEFNDPLYSPNSEVVSYYSDAVSSAGLFSPGFTYQVMNNDNRSTAINASTGVLTVINNGVPGISVTNVASFKGSSLLAYGYNTNTFTATFTADPICFSEGTKILCLTNNLEEKYIPIQDLQVGSVVKTYKKGYRRIYLLGKGYFINNVNKPHACMYVMKKSDDNNLLEDLMVTGGHAILVKDLGEYEEVNKQNYGENVMIEDLYLHVASHCPYFEQVKNEKVYPYYHFVVENDGDNDMRYGVYANGILSETPSFNQFMRHEFISLI